MKKYILTFFMAMIAINSNSQNQTVVIPNENDSRVITTGVPFLLIASDARAASMGDMGVATSVDVYSQFWNPSKYVFSESKSGFGLACQLIPMFRYWLLKFFFHLEIRSSLGKRYLSLNGIFFKVVENLNGKESKGQWMSNSGNFSSLEKI